MRYAKRSIAVLFLPLSALAGPPVPYDNWSAGGGTISAPCPSGYTCEENVNDRGILQRILTDASGRRHIQLIIHDSNAQGTLSIESFVNATENSAQNGIALKQTLTASDAVGTQLTVNALINTGWALDPTSPALRMDQTLTQNDRGVGFSSTFRYEVDRAAGSEGGNTTGTFLDIRQDLVNSSVLTDNPATGQDLYAFVLRQAGGDRVTQGGSVSLSGGRMGMMGGGGRGGTLSWQAGDTVQAIWVGQLCEGCQQGGGMGGMGGMGGGGGGTVTFSYQAFDNLSDTAGDITSYSLNSTDPRSWADPPFGAAPTLQ